MNNYLKNLVNVIQKLKNELMPHEQPQERIISSLYYLSLLGTENLKHSLKNSFQGIKQVTHELIIR